jgi:hypothetical protein
VFERGARGFAGASGRPSVQSTIAATPENATSANLPDVANQSSAASPSAQIPAADLKPLYDYVQDCRACQAQLAVAKQGRTDELAAMAHERDVAFAAAKGGTFWRRFRRNIEWFAIGAGADPAEPKDHRPKTRKKLHRQTIT